MTIIGLSARLGAAVEFIGHRDTGHPDAVNEFIRNIYTGESRNDAAFDFRERVLRSRIGAARLGRVHILGLMLKSLNLSSSNRCGALLFVENGAFPILPAISAASCTKKC